MIKNKDLAEFLQNELNAIGTNQYRITANTQRKSNGKVEMNSASYMQGVVSVVRDFPPKTDFGIYDANYLLQVSGDILKKDSIEEDFITLINSLNDDTQRLISGKGVFFELGKPTFENYEFASDGLNSKVFRITLDVNLIIRVEGILGIETELYVDNVKIPFIELSLNTSKSIFPNKIANSAGDYPKATGERLEVSLPIISNTKTQEILEAMLSQKANQKFTLKYVVGGSVTWEKDCYLKGGTMRASLDNLPMSFVVVFEKMFTAQVIEVRKVGDIDRKSIAVLSLNYSVNTNNLTTIQNGYATMTGRLLNKPQSIGAIFDISFLLDDVLAKLPSLYADVMTRSMGVIYDIKYGDYTYTMTIQSANFAFEEVAGAVLKVVFAETSNG